MSASLRIFEYQPLHILALLLLLAGCFLATDIDGFTDGERLGLSTMTWFWLVVIDAVLHQGFVWFCWRFELHAGLLSRWFGKAAFPVYAVIFAILILLRPILITALAFANRGSLPLNGTLGGGLAILLALPALYLGYSVKR